MQQRGKGNPRETLGQERGESTHEERKRNFLTVIVTEL